jgi:hypothetical protein
MEAWIDFGVVGLAAFILFIVCAFYEKQSANIPRFLVVGVIAGIPLGLVSDFVLWGAYTYPLGYGLSYLILNAAVIYGLFVATVLLLQKTRLVRFSLWIMGIAAIYEITNYFFVAWTYEVTPFLGWLSFVILGYFATAIFIACVSHFFFSYRFRFIDDLRN